jgi:hypothetical protein
VRVVVFSADLGRPLLVDEHYQARASHDLLVAAQSDYPAEPSFLRCGTEPVLWDMRYVAKAWLSWERSHLIAGGAGTRRRR